MPGSPSLVQDSTGSVSEGRLTRHREVASPLIRELLSLPCSDSRSVSPSRLIWDVLQPWTTLPLHTDGDSGMSAPSSVSSSSFSPVFLLLSVPCPGATAVPSAGLPLPCPRSGASPGKGMLPKGCPFSRSCSCLFLPVWSGCPSSPGRCSSVLQGEGGRHPDSRE